MKRMLTGFVVAIVLGSFGARAQEEIWTGGGANGGNAHWATAGNWLDGSAPVAGSALIFGQPFDLVSTNNLAGNVASLDRKSVV